jgi:hypothetical protein
MGWVNAHVARKPGYGITLLSQKLFARRGILEEYLKIDIVVALEASTMGQLSAVQVIEVRTEA